MRDPYPYPRFENDDNFAEGKQKQVKHHFPAPTQRVMGRCRLDEGTQGS